MRSTLLLCASFMVVGQMASALAIPPSCSTPSTQTPVTVHSEGDGRFMVFVDNSFVSNGGDRTIRLVDCATSQSLSVREDQYVIAARNGRPAARSFFETRRLLSEAITSDEVFTFRSLRVVLRENQGDGTLNNLPADHCGCEMFSEFETGATQ